MSAMSFNDQETFAGHKIGISTGEACFLMVIAFGLTLMNWYHMSNTLNNKLVNPDTSILFVGALYIIAGCIAMLEFPVTKSLVTNYRLNGLDFAVFVQAVLLLVIVSLAAGGGVYSNLADANKKDIRITAHSTQESSFEDLKRSLISDRNAARAQASRMTDKVSRQMETSRANGDYSRAIAKLKSNQSVHQSSRPASGAKTGSMMHWAITVLISLLCSLGVVFISGFLAVYYKPLVGKPALSLVSKRLQEWILNPEDIKSKQYEIDVMGNGNADYVKIERSGTNQANRTPPPTARNQGSSAAQKHPSQNRPEPVTTGMGATLGNTDSSGIRTPNNDYSEGGTFRAINAGDVEEARRAVIAGDLSPTIKPVKLWLLETRQVGISDIERQNHAKKLLDGMFKEGILILNPDQANTKQMLAKYVLASAVKSEEGTSNDSDHVDEFDITTRCGQCGDYAYTRIDELLDKQNGVVKCDGCGKGYMAQSHLTNDSNPITNELKEQAISSRKEGSVS